MFTVFSVKGTILKLFKSVEYCMNVEFVLLEKKYLNGVKQCMKVYYLFESSAAASGVL